MITRFKYEKAFINLINDLEKKYGKELLNLDGIGTQLDMSSFFKEFLSSDITADASVDSNSNVVDTTPAVLSSEIPKPYFRLNSYYLLWKKLRELYDEKIANDIIEDQINGTIYIHDVHGIGLGMSYCFNFSTLDIVNKGLPFVKKIKTVPPKYLYSFKSQLEQFIAYSSNSILGASGVADLLVVISWYVDKILKTKKDAGFTFKTENDVWKYIKETLVSFIYTINQPFRSGIQSPFVNISLFDENFLNEMKEDYIFPDGETFNNETVKKLQELFLETMNEELQRTPITFPVTTACFSVSDDGEILDKEFLDLIAKHNKEYGFINIYCGKSSTLSSCCRLRSDKENPYFNSFGAGKSKIGSLGVVTLNLPRLAWMSDGSILKFRKLVKKYADISARINYAKRLIIKKRILKGYLPLYSLDFMDINQQYSTVGINGIYEALEILGYNILTDEGKEVVRKILDIINSANEINQDRFESPHNLEQVPAENVSIKFADKDRYLHFNDKYDIYSNQFIPLVNRASMLERVTIQGEFDKEFSGGAILHVNVDEKLETEEQVKELIEYCARKGVIYWAINYNLQECEDGHISVGKSDICGICRKPIINNFTRVVGYLVNTKNFHKKRRELDYPNRTWYKNGDLKVE